MCILSPKFNQCLKFDIIDPIKDDKMIGQPLENKRNKRISCEDFCSMLNSDIVSLEYGFQTQGCKHVNKNSGLIFKDILY